MFKGVGRPSLMPKTTSDIFSYTNFSRENAPLKFRRTTSIGSDTEISVWPVAGLVWPEPVCWAGSAL
jgi:hypothetical protein